MFTWEIAILFVVALLASAVGFKKFIWFISIGYGLAISALSIGVMALFNGRNMSVLTWAYCIVMTCYGLRLATYLAYREFKTTYNKRLGSDITDAKGKSVIFILAVWVSCGVLYLFMMAPIIYRALNAVGTNISGIIGIIISALGVIMESLADAQKAREKINNPNKLCTKGLYRIVRCPNYLGELMIWTGVFVSAFNTVNSIGQWIVTIVGYICIIYIMFSGARRLEIRQDKNYANDPEYHKYKSTTPILLPLIPLYSVKKYKWLVA